MARSLRFRSWTTSLLILVASVSLSACSAIAPAGPQGATQVTPGSRGFGFSTQTTSNTWTMGANAPVRQFTGAAASIGNDIYLVGGEDRRRAFDENAIYDTTTNTWTSGHRMPTARTALAAVGLNGIVYAIGGELFNGTVLTTVEAYDPIANKWSTKAPLPVGVDSMMATVDNGLIYVVGGLKDSSGTPYNGVQTYDPGSDSWSSGAPLSIAKAFAFTGTVDGKIVAAAGYDGSGPTVNTEVYDPSTNAWTNVPDAKVARYGGCTGAIGDSLYVAAGLKFFPIRQAARELDAFDVLTNKWHRLLNIPRPMIGPASATVNGLLYCIGGSPFYGQAIFSNAVQIYQP